MFRLSAEAGFPSALVDQVYGLAVPKGTPPEIVQWLNTEFVAAFKEPAVVARMAELGLLIRAGAPQEMDATIRADAERFAKLIPELGIGNSGESR